jgi:hypothetical protein
VGFYLENTNHKKRAGGIAQGIGPEFKPQSVKKEKRKLGHILEGNLSHINQY